MQQASQSKQLFYGTSTERANLARQPESLNPGDVFTEVGSSVFEWDGSSWIQISTNGVAHNRLIASEVADAFQRYLAWTGSAGAADNAVIYTSPDVSAYNLHTITVSGTNSADVYASNDGTTYFLVTVELTDDVTTGGGVKVITIPTGKTGVLRGKFKYIRVLQDGATDANAVGAHGVG